MVLRLRLNTNPPPALYYHLDSIPFRYRLGVSDNPIIATDPSLELTALPDELSNYGDWLPVWLESVFYNRTQPPRTTHDLVSYGWNSDLSVSKMPFNLLGKEWASHNYLWTARAIDTFENWLTAGVD